MAAWFDRKADGVLQIRVHTQPGASKTEIAGLHDGRLKIRVAAPALEDRANLELTRFLAALFGVSRQNVELVRGHKSRGKEFAIKGSSVDPAGILAEER